MQRPLREGEVHLQGGELLSQFVMDFPGNLRALLLPRLLQVRSEPLELLRVTAPVLLGCYLRCHILKNGCELAAEWRVCPYLIVFAKLCRVVGKRFGIPRQCDSSIAFDPGVFELGHPPQTPPADDIGGFQSRQTLERRVHCKETVVDGRPLLIADDFMKRKPAEHLLKESAEALLALAKELRCLKGFLLSFFPILLLFHEFHGERNIRGKFIEKLQFFLVEEMRLGGIEDHCPLQCAGYTQRK